MNEVRLIRNPFLALAPLDDSYLAYDMERGRLHRLNPAAALILELCDGTRSAERLRSELAALDVTLTDKACSEWIDQACNDGLLMPSAPVSPTLSEILSQARSLRDHGETLAAFTCQRHATLLFQCDAGEWKFLGELAHIVGRRADAREAYEQYLKLQPDDAEISHILNALRDEPPPPRAPDRCIEHLYARFSEFYDDSMCGDLEYQAPSRLMEVVASELGERGSLDVLDLGCGTGLFGREVRSRSRRLTGVDLSPEMVALAQAAAVYDELAVGEITAWLASRHGAEFDLIAACDSLIYFGDLRQVVVPAVRLLRPGGLLAFTLERGETQPFLLTDSGRYCHTAAHVKEVAEEAGFSNVTISESFLRYEYGEPVTGLVAVLRR